MKSIKKARHKKEYSMLYDIHSHILPGVDDGAKDLQMALAMVDTAYREGIRYIVATPHYTPGIHNPSVETLQHTYESLVNAVRDRYPELTIELGNEVLYSPSVIEDLEKGKIMLMPAGIAGIQENAVLIEFSPNEDYKNIYAAVQKLVYYRYNPIIAHAERYKQVEAGDYYRELKEAGARLQVNATSKKDSRNRHYVKLARKLIKAGLADYLGTDAHNTTSRCVNTKEMVGYIVKYCSDTYRKELLEGKKE